jgi:predicted branched-subunit amino acid permease
MWQHPEFTRGAREMLDVSLGLSAWGLVTGLAMVQGGLSVPMALFMSLTVFSGGAQLVAVPMALFMSFVVFSGGAQLVAVPMMAAGSPVWVIWLTALCLNLRFAVFSATWRRYFHVLPRAQRLRMVFFAADFNLVYFTKRWPDPRPEPGQVPYYWGGVAINFTAWQLSSIAGILFGERIPAVWGVGFAGTLTLLALACGLIVNRATGVAATVAACAAVAAYALPLKLNVMVAIAAAVATGVMMDRRSEASPPTRP